MDLLTVLPPVVAIAIAIIWRNVYAALIVALVLSETLIAGFNPGIGALEAIDRTVAVFEGTGNTRILLFCLLIGALIAFMRDSGGVAATAKAMINSGFARTRRRAELAVAGTGSAIFVETNVSLLSSGVLGRPLYDAHGLSRERLAYIIDSTSAPISVILLINGWGAYALGLIEQYEFDNAVAVVAGSVPWNFYALLTLAGVYLTAFSGKVFGPMRTADARLEQHTEEQGPAPTKASYMWLPLLVMVGGALAFMTWTGGGNPINGSGSQSILWSIALAVLVAGLLLLKDRVFSAGELQRKAFQGIGEMVPLVTVLLLSIALGASLRALGTGDYIAAIAAGTLPAMAVPAILFLAAGLTSFMTGTSWGTYGILIPIAMPLAQALGIPPSLALAAVLGGGVFGDHCSPISDTTLIASVAAGTDHLSHVRTQMPYAVAAALVAAAMYLVAGLLV
ncbi:Na+/H+ antiporter NhaC family protein [Parvularcula sp. IMCC14364]|uniref:Na+/H+ antiporter NhaC family protein n=1 Tax=Parvularcula sp. IMCC14364 TaxID=3067902 RepID=UPI002740ACF6|nr:Na+/H+ antiporter NhaC family protein [Parvularcula sp. IMCC14364]